MARSDTRYSVYPAPKAVEIVGNSAPVLNQAIECWAALLARAMADNAKTFGNYEVFDLNIQPNAMKEWCVIAEVLKDVRFDPEFPNPGELLATAVEDANRLEDVGSKWFSSYFDGEECARGLERSVNELVQRLRSLKYPHAWAVINVIQWYWEHCREGIDFEKDQWWSLAFRRQWQPKQRIQDQRGRRRKKTEAAKSK